MFGTDYEFLKIHCRKEWEFERELRRGHPRVGPIRRQKTEYGKKGDQRERGGVLQSILLFRRRLA